MSDLMGRSYGLPGEVDEGDLDAELAALDDELEAGVGVGGGYMDDAGYMGEGVGVAAGGVSTAGGMPAVAAPAPAAVAASGGSVALDEFGAPVAQPA